MKLVVLYFNDPEKLPGHRFLGVILMKPDDDIILAKRSHNLGINPGGEIHFFDVDSDDLNENHLDRLLSEQECLDLKLFKKKKS